VRRTLDDLLRAARGKIERLEPAEAWSAAQDGALIVDTRSERSPGVVPGSLHRELGFTRVGDVVGGFEAWLAAGLPVTEAPPAGDGLPGMDSPV